MKPGAWVMLAAVLTMVIESSCSHAPPPGSPDDHVRRGDLALYEGENVVTRFHTKSGTTYVTSNYAVTDSFVVVNELLRDKKYYTPFDAHLYNSPKITEPPKDIDLPVMLPINQIDAMDKWESRSVARDVAAMVGVAIVAVVAVWIAVTHSLKVGAD